MLQGLFALVCLLQRLPQHESSVVTVCSPTITYEHHGLSPMHFSILSLLLHARSGLSDLRRVRPPTNERVELVQVLLAIGYDGTAVPDTDANIFQMRVSQLVAQHKAIERRLAFQGEPEKPCVHVPIEADERRNLSPLSKSTLYPRPSLFTIDVESEHDH